jgi:hypothetical protein
MIGVRGYELLLANLLCLKFLASTPPQGGVHCGEEFFSIKWLVKKCERSLNESVPADFVIMMSRNEDDR